MFHTSEASPGPYIYRASARRAWERTCSRWLRSGPKPATLVASGAPSRLVSLPVPGSSRTSPLPHKRSVARSVHISRFCPESVGANLFAMAAKRPKPATLVVSGAPRRLVLVPVPGSSRTSPLPHKRSVARSVHISRFCPEGVRTCSRWAAKRPKTGHPGCIWCTESAGFTAGSRQFADESAPTQAKRRPVRADNVNQNVAFARPSRYRSTSSAAMQPAPAEVIAWR